MRLLFRFLIHPPARQVAYHMQFYGPSVYVRYSIISGRVKDSYGRFKKGLSAEKSWKYISSY